MTDLKRLDWILTKAESGQDNLSAWEQGFVQDMLDRRSKYGERLRLSDRQIEVLEQIAEKAAG